MTTLVQIVCRVSNVAYLVEKYKYLFDRKSLHLETGEAYRVGRHGHRLIFSGNRRCASNHHEIFTASWENASKLMWWVYIFQLPLCLNIKRHLRLQTLPRAPPTMLWLWAEPSHALSIWGTVKWSPIDLNLGLEHPSKSSEWHIDCTKLKLRSQSKLLAKKYMPALRAVLKPMAYHVTLRILPPDVRSENEPFRPDTGATMSLWSNAISVQL